jgi:hypothetical protein
MPGSFALFGGSAVTKEWIFGLKDYSNATFFQNFCASIAGAVASITISAPLDVVKTRIQAARFDSTEGGRSIVKNMIRKEGLGAFFKVTPASELMVVGIDSKDFGRGSKIGLFFHCCTTINSHDGPVTQRQQGHSNDASLIKKGRFSFSNDLVVTRVIPCITLTWVKINLH